MLHFIVLTLYPEIFSSFLSQGLIEKARKEKNIKIETVNFRRHGLGKHLKVDSPLFGGGAGMLLRPEPIFHTLRDCEEELGRKVLKILVSPQGELYTQSKARELSKKKTPIILVCGRFEGFDERIRNFVDEEISMGDFILMGGEVVAMAIIESSARLVPGVLGNEESLKNESFRDNLLECSQYTRPFNFEEYQVPEILLSGDHGKIDEWRRTDAIKKTRRKRMDLYKEFMAVTDDGQ